MKDLFPQRLRVCRERRRMSRSALSQLCGLSRNVIGQYENGSRLPSIETVIQLADMFEVSLDWLCGRV